VNGVSEFEALPQEDVRGDLRQVFLGAIRMTLETLLEEEIRGMVGASRWARIGGRKDRRNGSYLRGLITSMGYLDVEVPRSRQGSAADVLGRYNRRVQEVDDAIVAAYVNGVSTRKMGKVTEALAGEQVGKSTVSRITRRLEEQVEELRRAPIVEPIRYLYLDGTFLDVRWARKVENVAALVAYGIGPDGKRRLLGITIGAQESEDSWTELLRQLTERGLSGVKLVIADAHAGLVPSVTTCPRRSSNAASYTFSETPSPRPLGASAGASGARSRTPSRLPPSSTPGSAWRLSERVSALSSPRRWPPSTAASLPQPSSISSPRPTGVASRRPMASSGSTPRSSAARSRWARSPTAPAPSGSSPRSRSR
jgi:Transposase, Mutator family